MHLQKIRPDFAICYFSAASGTLWNCYSLFLRGDSPKMQLKGCFFLLCHSSVDASVDFRGAGLSWGSEFKNSPNLFRNNSSLPGISGDWSCSCAQIHCNGSSLTILFRRTKLMWFYQKTWVEALPKCNP